MDIKSAYRIIPIIPSHRRYIVLALGPDCYWPDKVCPFGLSNAAGLEGEVADAVCDILSKKGGVPYIAKWVDDFLPSREPSSVTLNTDGTKSYSYSYDLADLIRILSPLGIPWSAPKLEEFSYIQAHIGFEWDLANRTVSFPDAK